MSTYIIAPPETIYIELHLPDPDHPGETVEKIDDFPFAAFLGAILNQAEFGKNWRSIKAAMEIDKAAKEAKGAAFEIHETAYELLKAAAEKPERGYVMAPGVLRQVGAYFECIIEAKEKKK